MYIVYPCIARISSVCYMFVPIKKKNSLRKRCVYKNRDSMYINYKYIYESTAYVCVYSKIINKKEKEKEEC